MIFAASFVYKLIYLYFCAYCYPRNKFFYSSTSKNVLCVLITIAPKKEHIEIAIRKDSVPSRSIATIKIEFFCSATWLPSQNCIRQKTSERNLAITNLRKLDSASLTKAKL